MTSAPNCLFFQGFEGLPEVLTRDVCGNDPGTSVGYPARELSLWAVFVVPELIRLKHSKTQKWIYSNALLLVFLEFFCGHPAENRHKTARKGSPTKVPVKQPENSREHPKKTTVLTVSAHFSAGSRLFTRDPLGTIVGCLPAVFIQSMLRIRHSLGGHSANVCECPL